MAFVEKKNPKTSFRKHAVDGCNAAKFGGGKAKWAQNLTFPNKRAMKSRRKGKVYFRRR